MTSFEFKKQYVVSQEQQEDKNLEEFSKRYSELLKYLKTIDFNKSFHIQKANVNNYKTLNRTNVPSESELSDEVVYNIISYIAPLLEPQYKEYWDAITNSNYIPGPKYKKYWDNLAIPKRSPEPDYSSMSENDRLNAQSQYKNKLQLEDKEIRLKTYINELHKKLLIYKDSDIREYFINLCTTILLQYTKSHPKEKTKIHFRFKSPKGLAIKLAKNIIILGHFEGNFKDGIDKFKYEDISDAFGAKIVSEKGFYPHASLDSEIRSLIAQRRERIDVLTEYEIFNEQIETMKSDYNTSISITYGEYFSKCLDILTDYKKIINTKEKKVLELIDSQIAYINEQIVSAREFSILNERIQIADYKIFDDHRTNFKDFLTAYQNRIPSDLSLAGLKRGLNTIFYNSGTTDDDILLQSLLSAFGVKASKSERKYTASGHEGIHYDIETPYGKIELQAQDESQYEFDKRSITAAHSLMDGKSINLYTVPEPCNISTIDNSEEFEEIPTNDGSICYYRKKELNKFRKIVEILTAKKGKITYNEGMECAQVDLYSSIYNYKALAMEIPKNHPAVPKIKRYFDKLNEKPFWLRQKLFKRVDTITYHTDMSRIKSKVFGDYRKIHQNSINIK